MSPLLALDVMLQVDVQARTAQEYVERLFPAKTVFELYQGKGFRSPRERAST